MNPEQAFELAGQYFQSGNLDKATEILFVLRKNFPGHPGINYMLGASLAQKGDLVGSLRPLQDACHAEPKNAAFLNVFGSVLLQLGKVKEAHNVFLSCAESDPDFDGVYNNLGVTNKMLLNFDESIRNYQRAVKINLEHGDAWNNLGHVFADVARIEESLHAFEMAQKSGNCRSNAYSNWLLTANYSDSISRDELFERHCAYGEALVETGFKEELNFGRDKSGRIVIAYLSPDFRRHSVAFFVESVLRHHDSDVFRVVCLFDSDEADYVTERIKGYDIDFRFVSSLSDDELGQLCRDLDVHILIELAGHTGKNRLEFMASRRAPVQVTWLGYPNTTGLKSVDYRIVDHFTDPSPEYDAFMSETPIRLDGSFICYTGDDNLNSSDQINEGNITLGSFNKFSKVSDECWNLWLDLLISIEGAKLVLKDRVFACEKTCSRLLARAKERGVSESRIQLLSADVSDQEHMARYNDIDIALDTYPFHGATTTFEALWMGVPVLSLCGDRHSSRVGHSILSNVCLADLSCVSKDDFIEKGIALAGDRERRSSLKQTLRQSVKNSAAGDAQQFTRNFEAALLKVCQ